MPLNKNDIERIAITNNAENRQIVVTNTSLSQALLEELSAGISNDGIIALISIYLSGNLMGNSADSLIANSSGNLIANSADNSPDNPPNNSPNNSQGKWYNFSGNPTSIAGIDEQGRPIYKTIWNEEEWLYLPFDFTMTSLKASGEIISGGLSIANYHKDIAIALENPRTAIPIKIYLVSLKTQELIQAQERMFLVNLFNDGVQIQGEIKPADILAEQLPSLRNYPQYFRR